MQKEKELTFFINSSELGILKDTCYLSECPYDMKFQVLGKKQKLYPASFRQLQLQQLR